MASVNQQQSNFQQSQLHHLASDETGALPKKRNFLKAFYFAFKFLQKMRFVRKYKNIYMLERKHFKLIKDLSFGGLYERSSRRGKFSKLFSGVEHFLFDIKSPLQTFEPNSFLHILFDAVLFVIITFLLFYVPLKVCFEFAYDFQEAEVITAFMGIVPYLLIGEMVV